AGAKFVEAILFVEQPLPRDTALSHDTEGAIRKFSKTKPLIIDESDNDVTSLLLARDVGYSGISAKNCKGTFKAILNKCLIAKWNKDGPSATGQTVPHILSSEDGNSLSQNKRWFDPACFDANAGIWLQLRGGF
ncbi:hypothetical protein HY256_03890, partial [Candidatus Sumerlaeota bacterium]|nr:hypothetical protein [Candidatus Sumerlaeota bacterium]